MAVRVRCCSAWGFWPCLCCGDVGGDDGEVLVSLILVEAVVSVAVITSRKRFGCCAGFAVCVCCCGLLTC